MPTQQMSMFYVSLNLIKGIIASTSISLKIFSENKNFLNYEDPTTNIKRSPVTLFDSLKNPIAKLDATVCISLLDRNSVQTIRERERLKGTAIKDARIKHGESIPDIYEDSKYDLTGTHLLYILGLAYEPKLAF
jgi:hypothetical protein